MLDLHLDQLGVGPSRVLNVISQMLSQCRKMRRDVKPVRREPASLTSWRSDRHLCLFMYLCICLTPRKLLRANAKTSLHQIVMEMMDSFISVGSNCVESEIKHTNCKYCNIATLNKYFILFKTLFLL